MRSTLPSSRRQHIESAQQSLAVARAKSIHQLRSKPPNLAQPECGPIAGDAIVEPSVLDDLPEVIPVAGRELDAIETYLGNLIDQLLLDAACDTAITPASTSTGHPALDRD